ncbi:hypothetical protein AB0D67_32580 [Streptosporangium sp. NPDC048047]|uniref:hypothetical protein n=1 Tax=Streptosporangium sp. NPDC048047 TaxID=3155748 RepID=UPI003445C1C0
MHRGRRGTAGRPGRRTAALVCLIAGIVAGVLVWLTPAVWPPVDAAMAVMGLSLALYGLRRGRRCP